MSSSAPRQRGGRHRDDAGDQEQRRSRAKPTESGKPRIGRREPHERRPVVISERTEPPVNLAEELANWKDSAFADEPGDLNGQRHERDQIDDTK